jgi:glyoxylase-like metal-dependent hydrolase (beta-lactamase superfamily II)
MAHPDLLPMTPSLHRLRIPGTRAHLLNVYLWSGPDGVTVIDSGWPDSAALIADALAALGHRREQVSRLVLTHFHEDHTGSAAEIASWADVEVVAGRGDVAFVQGTARGPLPVLTAGERRLHGEFTEPSHGPPCRVDCPVWTGDVLDFAGGARVLGIPGHTPGSIALHLPEADAVLTGDAVAEFDGAVILGVFNVDRAQARAALAVLAETGAQIGGFGHGEVVLDAACERIARATDPFGSDPG